MFAYNFIQGINCLIMYSSNKYYPGYLTKAVVVVGGGGGKGCKTSCNLGGQSPNMLPFTKKSEKQILRIVISSILRIK